MTNLSSSKSEARKKCSQEMSYVLWKIVATYSCCFWSEAPSIVTTKLTTYSKHTGRPGDYRFLLWKSEIRASNSTARGAIKKCKSVSTPRKLKYCISQVTKAVVCPIFGYNYAVQ